jgi:hypothetical protein
MADRKRKSSRRGLPRIEDGPDLDAVAARGLTPDEIFLPTERRAKDEPMEEQPIAACGPSPGDTDGRVEVFGFRHMTSSTWRRSKARPNASRDT